jgi:hypothetical protein
MILVLTYTTKDFLKEKTKDVSDSLLAAESLYRTENIQSSLSLQEIAYRQINQINQINKAEPAHPNSEKDYSEMIRGDLVTVQQLLGDLNVDFDAVSRFIDKLPSGGASGLRQARDQIHQNVDITNQQVHDLVKPSPKHDWYRAVGVKLAIIMIATTEVPVQMLGDSVLTTAHRLQEAADRAYQFTVWSSYLLYVMGVALALYANLSGTQVPGEGV